MFKKIFKFFIGYVIIEISGREKERFVNMCMHNGLYISDVLPCENGLRAVILRNDFRKIRRLVKKSGVRVRLISKHGLRVFLSRNKKRYGFISVGILVGIFLLIAPQYIWCIEIDGAYMADTEKIKQILSEHGVYVGAKKSSIGDLSDIKDSITGNVDEINWAWLYMEGTRARLQVQEGTPIPDIEDSTTPTDIVAITDGWVTSAHVMRGERRVNEEMNVSEGQLLVSGKVPVFPEGEEEKYIYVHSKAKIFADTIRSESGFFKSTETLRVKTGNMRKCVSVTIFGKEFKLFRSLSGDYIEFDCEENRHDLDVFGYTGLSYTVYTVHEVDVVENELNEHEIIMRAKEQLEERICRKLQCGAIKKDEELTYNKINGLYEVELRMHLKENIGMEVPAEE